VFMMGAIFGKKRKREEEKKPKISDKDRAVLDLKRQKIKMKNYRTRINATLEKEIKVAKTLIKAKKKKKALLVLKKKKYLETLVERTEGALLNIEKLVDSIEYASMQKQIFEAMKAGENCLSELNKQLSLEEVEKLMEDTEEAIAYTEEVSDMLAQNLTNENIDDVNKELEQLEKEDAEFRALEIEDRLPDAPKQNISDTTTVTAPKQSIEAKEEKKLVAALA